jgi:hypothetical protein
MINNLSSYFLPEYQFFLQNIDYEKKENIQRDMKGITLSFTDNLSASIDDANNTVNVLVTRSVSFNPDVMFHVSVTYGAILKFSDKKDEIKWDDVDLSNELLNNGQFFTRNLMARITLLIGEITSASGQTPLFMPPNIIAPDSMDVQ